jgi:hypothetical protein
MVSGALVDFDEAAKQAEAALDLAEMGPKARARMWRTLFEWTLRERLQGTPDSAQLAEALTVESLPDESLPDAVTPAKLKPFVTAFRHLRVVEREARARSFLSSRGVCSGRSGTR